MNNTTLASIEALISTTQGNVEGGTAQLTALQTVLTIAQTGWQSDQAVIAQGIADGIATQLPDAIAAETTVLQGQVADLTSQLATANATIESLQAQIAALQADPTQDVQTNEVV